MTVRLRILSGAHQGAELDLTPGEWSFGSDALCDILLSDVAAQQATLRVDEQGAVFLLPPATAGSNAAGQNQSLLQGEPVPAQGCPLPYFACLQWGAVCVAVGPDDAAWPPVALPDEHAAPDGATGRDAGGNNGQKRQDGQSAQDRQSGQSGQSGQPQGAASPAQGPLNLTTPPAQGFDARREHGGFWGSARNTLGGLASRSAGFSPARLGLVLLLLALTAGGVWQWQSADSPQQRRENMEAVLRAEGLKPAAFTLEERRGVWTVHGVVNDNKQWQDVSAALRGLGLHTDIVSRQSVVEALQARIEAEGARLTVTQRGDTVRVAGYVYDARSLQALLQPLEADCARAQVRQDVIFWQELRQPLKDSLAALKLQERVRLTPGPYTIALDTTALGAAQQEALRTLEREVLDMTRGISPLTRPVSVTVATTSPRPQMAAPKALLCEQLRVQRAGPATGSPAAASGGALVVVFDGREYAPGAHLPSGMQVQEVRPEYVTLVQGQRLVYCPAQ